MSAELAWPWVPLVVLGAVHGVNPGMGWLFAVALGLQEQNRRAVWRALVPLALGHAAAIAVAVAVALVLGELLPGRWLRWIVAVTLVTFGIRQLVRHRHRSWRGAGMRVGFRDLVVWSFLMATAHGAGLMAIPFVPATPGSAAHSRHVGGSHEAAVRRQPTRVMAAAAPEEWQDVAARGAGPGHTRGVVATVVHTLGYLLVTAFVAAVVYERLGVRILRNAWINLDAIWATALVVTGVLALV